jgi:hypothetical protein
MSRFHQFLRGGLNVNFAVDASSSQEGFPTKKGTQASVEGLKHFCKKLFLTTFGKWWTKSTVNM